jgi:hypothetical protein
MRAQESQSAEFNNGRRTISLSSALEKSLSAYASAAVAAGVSLLAMANPAEAKIIYTPANTTIPVNNTGAALVLDLNHDGVADFSFVNSWHSFGHGSFSALSVGCAVVPVSSHNSTCRSPNNEIWGRGMASGRFASALRPSFKVGANKSYFQQGRKRQGLYPPYGPIARMANATDIGSSGGFATRSQGQWLYTKHRYLGFRFTIGGQTHYGWARLAVTQTAKRHGIQATLTGYAYETIPNKPIITGKTKGPDVLTLQPATLGHLATGASATPVWRMKQTAATTH